MKKLSLVFYFLLSICLSQAQVTLFSESFETDGEGTRYFSNTYMDCPNSDFFFRTNTNPVTPPACTQLFQSALTNLQGSYFWASEDIRTSTPVPGSRPPGQITTQSFSISNYNTLTVYLYLATSANNNTRWETADSINIQASFDGTNYSTVGRFMGDAVTGGRLRIDGNLDGAITGADPATTCDQVNFTKYSFSIPGTGTVLYIRLDFDQMGGTEELAIDLIEVTGIAIPCTMPSIITQPADNSTCAGNNTSFSVTASGTVPLSYQWQVNDGSGFVNITNGGVYSNAATATLNLTGVTVSMSGYLYKCIVTNLCGGDASNNATLIVNANNFWVGNISSDWNNAANWSCGVPTSAIDVAITGFPVNHPVILPGATGNCKNMLKGGLTLTLNLSGATLKIFGNLTYNAGSFITNASSNFQFVGSAVMQTFGGLTPLTINNLTLINSSGLLMNQNITLSGALNLQSGKIFTNGFWLKAGSITGATSTNYIVTGDNLGNPAIDGGLTIPVSFSGGIAVLFPIGPTASAYNPVSIDNTSGPTEDFNARVNLLPVSGADASKSVQRTWQIDELTAPGGNTADIMLQWDETHEGPSFIRSICGIYKSDGTNIDYIGYMPQNGSAANISGNTWTKTLAGITSFSPWGVTSDAVILPIKLLSFDVRKTGLNAAIVTWQIDEASTPDYFQIEKSSDGSNFTLLTTIHAANSINYTYTDNTIQNGKICYRLKMIDRDGSITYSKVVLINSSRAVIATVYPNPVKDKIGLNIISESNQPVTVSVIDINAKSVMKQSVILLKGPNNIDIPAGNISAGMYLIKVENVNGNVIAVSKLIKE